MTINELLERFPDEDSCREHLVNLRWPNGKVACPRCGASERIYALKARPFHWLCKNKECGGRNDYRFSLTTGTIFEHTRYPLRIWFQVLFLMLQSKKGMSALQMQRMIFKKTASYETVWYMCHRLRAAMKEDGFFKIGGGGEVEVDETYIPPALLVLIRTPPEIRRRSAMACGWRRSGGGRD